MQNIKSRLQVHSPHLTLGDNKQTGDLYQI